MNTLLSVIFSILYHHQKSFQIFIVFFTNLIAFGAKSLELGMIFNKKERIRIVESIFIADVLTSRINLSQCQNL